MYMKEEINNNKITKEKLSNPFYRLDYLKEYAFRYIYKNNNEIYNDFIEKYGDIPYNFSMIKEEDKKNNY